MASVKHLCSRHHRHLRSVSKNILRMCKCIAMAALFCNLFPFFSSLMHKQTSIDECTKIPCTDSHLECAGYAFLLREREDSHAHIARCEWMA